MSDAFDEEIVVRRRNPWVALVASLPFVVAAVLGAFSLIDTAAYATMIPHFIVLGIVTAVAALRQNPWPREHVERVGVEDGVLRVGAEAIPLAEIENAVIVPSPPFPKVLVERRGPKLGPIEVVVRSVKEGRRLLRALGYDASQRVFRTTAVSWLRATWTRATLTVMGTVGAAFVLSAFSSLLHLPPTLALAVIVLPLVTLAMIPTKISVGGDGIYVEWLRWKRFIPIGDVLFAGVTVERTRNNQRVSVKLSLRDSDELILPMGSSWDVSRAHALVERIDEVRAAAGGVNAEDEDSPPMAVEAVIARLSRTADATRDWLRALRALGAGSVATHRVAPVAPETFLRIVEDASAKPTDRAAAAVALASNRDSALRDRIRVATETVAEPKLRVALGRSLEDDEDALAEALDDLERDAAP